MYVFIISNMSPGLVFFKSLRTWAFIGVWAFIKDWTFIFSTLQFILVNQLCWDNFHVNYVYICIHI